jgi:hypothetical protein
MFESVPSLAHCVHAILRAQRRVGSQAWNGHRDDPYEAIERLSRDCECVLLTFGTNQERFISDLASATSATFAERLMDGWLLEKIERRDARRARKD